MAGIDLTTATSKLTEYLAAETKVLAGQDVTIDGTRFTRADLAAVQKGIEIWNSRIQRLSRVGGMLVREVIPR
jgi:LDH2 family malate/lactate/ureidoglycolate dehydrogenase